MSYELMWSWEEQFSKKKIGDWGQYLTLLFFPKCIC